MLLFWNPVIFTTGCYLMAVADIIDGAIAVAAPANPAQLRRSQFKVIQGGRL
jgi:hypothetical protein